MNAVHEVEMHIPERFCVVADELDALAGIHLVEAQVSACPESCCKYV